MTTVIKPKKKATWLQEGRTAGVLDYYIEPGRSTGMVEKKKKQNSTDLIRDVLGRNLARVVRRSVAAYNNQCDIWESPSRPTGHSKGKGTGEEVCMYVGSRVGWTSRDPSKSFIGHLHEPTSCFQHSFEGDQEDAASKRRCSGPHEEMIDSSSPKPMWSHQVGVRIQRLGYIWSYDLWSSLPVSSKKNWRGRCYVIAITWISWFELL
jgi:hypothetical protein